MSAVDDSIFDVLEAKTARQTILTTGTRVDWTPLLLAFFVLSNKGETATDSAGPVSVVSTAKIAGYEAVVLDVTEAADGRSRIQSPRFRWSFSGSSGEESGGATHHPCSTDTLVCVALG